MSSILARADNATGPHRLWPAPKGAASSGDRPRNVTKCIPRPNDKESNQMTTRYFSIAVFTVLLAVAVTPVTVNSAH